MADSKKNVQAESGGINPSAPTSGTEGWGHKPDERQHTSNDASATRAGQMKGDLGDSRTAQTQRAEEAATSNKRPSHANDDQADLSRRTSASSFSMNTSHGGTDHTFRCADAGNGDCRWETSAGTEDEIMQRVEEHGRRDHGMADWTEAIRKRVKDAIRRREAA